MSSVAVVILEDIKVLCLSIYADQNTASVVAKATIIRLRPRPRPHPSRPRPGLSRPRSRPEVSDCQVYGSCSPSHVDAFLSTIHATSLISSTLSPAWCNPTECNSTTTRPSSCGVRRFTGPTIGSFTLTPSSTVRDLGVYIDSDLSMQSHVQRTVSRCFAVLRQLRTIRRQKPTAVFQSLVVALVLSRLDYCSSVLFGLPTNLITRLQSVQNAAAWLIIRIRRSKHITAVLTSLH